MKLEKLYNNLVKDCTNKVIITDCTFSKSILPSSLPLLPPSNEQQQSHTRSSPITTTTNQTHSKFDFLSLRYEEDENFGLQLSQRNRKMVSSDPTFTRSFVVALP